MLQAIERYMKQAIVDKVPSVSSSALVSSLVCNCGQGPAGPEVGGKVGCVGEDQETEYQSHFIVGNKVFLHPHI